MKKKMFVITMALVAMATVSCKKDECSECHYENDQNEEVELGEYCGDDLEASGYNYNGVNYEVHCHEH